MIDEARYLTYVEAVVEHFELMRRLEEARFGVFEHSLVISALARPELAVESDQWGLSQLEEWMANHIQPFSASPEK